MTGIGIFGLLLGLVGLFFAFRRWTRLKVTVFALAYLMHVGAVVMYYTLVRSGGGDSLLYYEDPYGYYADGIAMGTQFIVWITQTLRYWFDGTYFDYFILFGSVGFFGIALMMRIFEELYDETGGEIPLYIYLLLFIPGVHYWTSAIGKDGLFFFAMVLSIWGAMRIRQRIVPLAAGLGLMLMIRPHVAVVACAALAIGFVGDKRISLVTRVGLGVLAAAGMGAAVAATWSAFQIDLTNIDSVSDALAGREALLQTEAAGASAVNASYPMRVIALLFRPMFIDANGALGLIVSLENALLVPVIGTMLIRARTAVRVARAAVFARYALVMAVGVLLMLAIGYYNMGLGIRQKATMILPGLIIFFVALQAVGKARREAVADQGVPATSAYA